MPQRAALVIDYQNVHLTGHEVFNQHRPVHEALIDPVRYARAIERVKNSASDPQFHVSITKIDVYRGLPHDQVDPDGYRRNLAQRAAWMTSPAAPGRLTVTYRPLTYRKRYDGAARKSIIDESVPPTEKGVDVLVALSICRHARDETVDTVIVASRDSDLLPAFEEVLDEGNAQVEAVKWYNPEAPWTKGSLRIPGRHLWTTSLGAEQFRAAVDPRDYA